MLLPARRTRDFIDGLMLDPFETFLDNATALAKPAPTLMKTDIKETDAGFELTIDLPGFKKEDVKLDLQNGRIDAVFGDTAVVTEWLKSNPKLAAVGDKVTDKAYFGTGLGIAVRQGNTDLQQKFNAALEKVKKDGTYQTIYNKWFQK